MGRIQRIVRDAHVNIEDDYLRALAYRLAKKRIEKEVYQRIKVRPGNFFAGALLYFAMSIIYLLIAPPIPHISETGIGLGRRVLLYFLR